MSTLLAFDTSTEFCSVALSHAGSVHQMFERLDNRHSEVLLPWIDTLLSEHALKLTDVDGIVFGAGPGSFTGLRIACGVAQGLAYGADKKVCPISTLASIAYHFREKAPVVAVLNDARMSECYGAIYAFDGAAFKCLQSEQLIKPDAVSAWLAAYQVGFVAGTAIGVYDMAIACEAQFQAPEAAFMIEYVQQEAALKSAWVAAELAAPLYIRNRVALTIKERQDGERL